MTVESSFERRTSRPGVWFRDDILDTLAAVDAANWDIAQHIDSREMLLYRMGFEAAIQAVAAAFGLAYQPRSLTSRKPLRVIEPPE